MLCRLYACMDLFWVLEIYVHTYCTYYYFYHTIIVTQIPNTSTKLIMLELLLLLMFKNYFCDLCDLIQLIQLIQGIVSDHVFDFVAVFRIGGPAVDAACQSIHIPHAQYSLHCSFSLELPMHGLGI